MHIDLFGLILFLTNLRKLNKNEYIKNIKFYNN